MNGTRQGAFFSILLLLAVAVSPAARGGDIVVPDAVPAKARLFALSDVHLLSGFIKEKQDRNLQYLLQLEPERFLWNFRKYAGLPTPGKPYGGWEGPNGFCRGHITGHYLSACAEAYAVTGDARFKHKGDNLVAGLAECQKAWGDGYLGPGKQTVFDALERGQPWPSKDIFIVPYYVIHKIMAGLLDQYVYCGNRQALEVAEGMAGYFKKRLDRCTPAQIERMFDTRQANPQNEFGGMSEAMHNLYALTGKPEYLATAHVFDRGWFLDPLAHSVDDLTRLHSNTHTPQMLGAMRHYELTGYEPYRRAALFFWQQTALKRAYVHGGTSGPRPEGNDWRPASEHWARPGELAKTLTPGIAESCVCHNMLKVTSKLFVWTAEPQYADFYERAYFNSVLGMQTPKYPGGYIYPYPLSCGSQKKFSTPENDFWCCCGTAIEAFTRLAENIYFHDDRTLWVNLFVASEVHWKARGLSVRQETRFPEEEGTRLRFSTAKPVELTVQVHVPYWATRGVTVRVNGQPLEAASRPTSFLPIRRTWSDGDLLEVAMPMGLHLHPMPDDPKLAALMYGPIALAAMTATDLTWPGDGKNLLAALKPVAGQPLEFTLALRSGPLRLVPLYRIVDERYGVYFRLLDKSHEKRYTATAWLELQHPALGSFGGKDAQAKFEICRGTQKALIKSRFVIVAALRDTKLKNRACILREDAAHQAIQRLTDEIHVDVDAKHDNIIQVSATEPVPEDAAAIVNAVVNAYMSEVIERDRQLRLDRLSGLQQITAKKEEEVRTKREELKRALKQKGNAADSEQVRAEMDKIEHILRGVAEERERLKIELNAYPRVNVLGDRNSPAAVPTRPD